MHPEFRISLLWLFRLRFLVVSLSYLCHLVSVSLISSAFLVSVSAGTCLFAPVSLLLFVYLFLCKYISLSLALLACMHLYMFVGLLLSLETDSVSFCPCLFQQQLLLSVLLPALCLLFGDSCRLAAGGAATVTTRAADRSSNRCSLLPMVTGAKRLFPVYVLLLLRQQQLFQADSSSSLLLLFLQCKKCLLNSVGQLSPS